ncbi:hypothetical protein LCGC14_1255780 [marine sediment metagenome]|uniref:Uncharacterized protein n=1 Tax=marine sediment metagenome TaxID=412755 RepID=A0A0F9P5I9_9ZZZZ
MDMLNGLEGSMANFVLAGFVAVVAVLAGVFATSLVADQRHTKLKQAEHGERLSSLEAFNEGLRDDVQGMDKKLNRILERMPQ